MAHLVLNGTGAKTAREDNKLQVEDQAGHNWYRFVLSFPPHLVRHYLQRFGVTSHSVVLDPFCGTGTTLVECKKLGIPSIGIDPNPMASFASRVKVNWSVDPDALLNHAREIANIASKRLVAQGLSEVSGLPLFGGAQNTRVKLRTLSGVGSNYS